MYPTLFGFIDSYMVMMVVGFIAALLTFFLFLRYRKYGRNQIIDLLLCGVVAIAAGIVCSILFQNVYDLINYGSSYKWTWGMTFYGGVFGGAAGFVLMYLFYYKKHNDPTMKDILVIAPGAITLAHAFGRIGCFLDGCCYGKATDSWIGIVFPVLNDGIKRIPTQLIESLFLFLLSALLIVFAFKSVMKHTFAVYMFSYATFRFVIEFFRDDYRGKIILGMSPSQLWCIVLVLAAPAVIILFNKFVFRKGNENEKTAA